MRKVLAICILIVLATAVACAAQSVIRTKGSPRSSDGIKPEWWPGEGPGNRPRNVVTGIVVDVNAKSITIENRQGSLTFTVTDNTRVVVRGERARITDVKKGDPATVKFAVAPDGSRIALGVLVPKPRYAGKITAISGDTFTLAGREQTWNVIIGPATKIESHGYIGTAADIRIGYRATVEGEVSGSNIHAAAVHFQPTVIKGVVESVSGNEIGFRTVRGKQVTVTVTDATVVWVRPRTAPNRRGTLADVKPNTPANIGGHVNPETRTVQAIWIDLLTASDGTGAGQSPAPGIRERRRIRINQ